MTPTSKSKRPQPISETSIACLWDWDLQTNQIWRSERFNQVFGQLTGDIDSSVDAWYNRIHPEDKEASVSYLLSVIDQGGEWADEYRLQRADGSYAHVYDQGFAIFDQGKPLRMTGSIMDVSDRAMQQSRDEHRKTALDSAEMGTWILDINTKQVSWDSRCRAFLGYTKGDHIDAREIAKLIHPADLDLAKSLIGKALLSKSDGRFENECRLTRVEDHALRWVRFRGKVTASPDGIPIRIAGTAVDVTKERQERETLQLIEKHFPTAFNNASVGIVITQTTGRFVQVNKAFDSMTGYSPGELDNGTYSLMMQPDDLLRYQNQLDGLLSSGSGSVAMQVRCRHKQGHDVWLNLHTTLIHDALGHQESLFSIIQDVTQDVATRNEQQKLLTLVGSSLSFMAIADLQGRVTYINKAGRELVGLDETEFLKGATVVADFYTPEQYNWMLEVPIPALLSQGYWSGRVQLKHFITGEAIPCHANGIRIDDPITGQAIGRGFMMRDLRSELAAEVMQRKLFALVDNSVELMSILEMDGKNSYINKAGMAMLGFDNAQQVQEIPISQLHAPEHFALVEQQVLPSVMNTGRWSGEMLVRHLQTGEIFPVFNNTIRIDDPDSGQPIGVGAVMRDRRPELLAQQVLLESEARFRSMIMQAPVAIALLRDEAFIIESANDYILQFWGKTPTIIGKPLLEALPELDGQPFVDLIEGVYQSGNPHYGYEVLARLHRNGQLEDCYFNFVYAPVRSGTGTINGVIVVATEVTGQVQAKQELVESERRFKSLILDAPMATAVYTGHDMVVELANEAMLTLWGKDASVIGKKLSDALPELEGQPFHQLLDDVYTTGVAYQGTEDKADLVVDGRLQTFYFNFTYKPLRDATGKVYAILNMAVDITYQVTARQQFKEAEEGLREAVNLAELAPWTTNVLTGEMTCSERVNGWLGIEGPITSALVNQCIHPKDLQRIDSIVYAAMEPTSTGRMDMEYTIINQQTQQEHIMRTQARVIFDQQGMPTLVRGTSQDITAQRLTEQALEKQVQLRTEELIKSNLQLERSNQELERYAYVASHDLQEPLRKIQMYSNLLQEHHFEEISPEGRDYLAKLEKSASRMTILIKNILDFSRINYESGFVDHVNLNDIVGQVVKDFDLLLTEKNGRVEDSELCAITAIPLQMTQLFYNLISNSLKFTQPNIPPVITISSRPLTSQEVEKYKKLDARLPHCEITFSDNGIGFSPAFSEKIFGLFQRLHHQRKYAGTGIGLSLCQRIVFNHQGEIWAEAEEGKGATFHIILPIHR